MQKVITFNEYLKAERAGKNLDLTQEQVEEMQKRLGVFCQFYFLTDEKDKCCNVYPMFKVKGGFDETGYYECLVCGKRTINCHTNSEAMKEWRKINGNSID